MAEDVTPTILLDADDDQSLKTVRTEDAAPPVRSRTARHLQRSLVHARKTKDTPKSGRPIVVDTTDHIAGRLASHVAKLLLNGERVSLVNCEKIMISGSRRNIIKEYRDFLEIASILHPKHGPFHPRRPDTIMTRMIRGMLPRKKPSGRAAHKRLRAYIGTPAELESFSTIQFQKAKITRPAARYTTMTDLGETVGWTR